MFAQGCSILGEHLGAIQPVSSKFEQRIVEDDIKGQAGWTVLQFSDVLVVGIDLV